METFCYGRPFRCGAGPWLPVPLCPDSSGCSSFSSAGAHLSSQAAFELTQGGEFGACTPVLSVGSKNQPPGRGISCSTLWGRAESPPEAPALGGAPVCTAPFRYLSLQEPNDSVCPSRSGFNSKTPKDAKDGSGPAETPGGVAAL